MRYEYILDLLHGIALKTYLVDNFLRIVILHRFDDLVFNIYRRILYLAKHELISIDALTIFSRPKVSQRTSNKF